MEAEQCIAELEAENARLRAENDELRQLIRRLQDQIEALQRAAARQAAPFRRQEKNPKLPEQH